MSFAGLGFLTFYLAGKLHLFDKKGHTTKAWLALTPLSGAALVAISRTMDYRHHWQDVLVGSILGLATSYFAYRQYYPHLSHPRSHKPFSPRIARVASQGDEEAGRPESSASGNPMLTPRLNSQRSRGKGGALATGIGYPRYLDDEDEGSGSVSRQESVRSNQNGREHGRGPSEDVELMPST